MQDQAASLRKLVENKKDSAAADSGTGAAREAPESSAARPVPKEGARIIAVTSGKGGVGKSNLTVNLALAFLAEGKKTLVIDADLGMANVDVLLGTSSRYNLLNLLDEDVVLDDVILKGPYGLRYISGGSGMEQAGEFTPAERDLLEEKLTGCGELADVILIDTGAGIGRNVLDFILAADEVILVTTPEPTAMTDAYAVMKAYSMYAAKPNMRLVVNRVYDEAEGLEVAEKLRKTAERFLHMEIQFLGAIYEDRTMIRAVRQQKPILEAYPDALAAKCIKAIARAMLYGEKVFIKKGWKSFLQYFLDFTR
ncbi:MinD/ParA family protein [Selenomonas sputigena]|uniref:MinD/ParA family protein n=1 Tax=Selenomonas sputigena TaxID=69823 RepID=UPI0022305067|nr:MinD/ParA family protein [Selenomonas sputigena]UZD43182.1 MinD/ParA family protein [Selenomonas sputigena]